MRKSRFALAIVAVTAGFVGITGTAAQAHDHSGPSPTTTPAPNPSGAVVFLAAELSGRNEVPVPGGPAVGDPDGRAVEVFRIQGNQVSFGVAWRNLGPLTASHIHEGAAGVNGPVKVPFFGTALPANLNGATGKVTVADPALLEAMKANPEKFYANLHTTEFPGGAVRGQLRKLSNGVDLVRFLDFGALVSLLDGDQEVPVAGGPAVGDPDGHATGFISAYGRQIDFSFTFFGIAPPTLGHIHQGRFGVNGPVVVPLFAATGGLPASLTGVSGTASGLSPDIVRQVRNHPRDFYTNLHTAEFPGGAVRGQIFRPGRTSTWRDMISWKA
jgi:CHRD domain